MNSNSANDVARLAALMRRMLDPDDLGFAVTAEVRRLVSAELAALSVHVDTRTKAPEACTPPGP